MNPAVLAALISATPSVINLFKKQPKVPKYEPSQWEKDYYSRLQDVYSGKSEFTNLEPLYQAYKERILPEYARVGKEAQISFARRGIEGGPEIEFAQRSGERQLEDLMRARRQIEEETRKLRLAASSGMGQLGSARSAAESQRAIAEFQSQLAQYNAMQQALQELGGTAGALAYDYASPQQDLYAMYQQLYGSYNPYMEQIGITPEEYNAQISGQRQYGYTLPGPSQYNTYYGRTR